MRSNDWNLQLDIVDLVLRCNLIAGRVMTYWNDFSWKVAAPLLRNLTPKSDIILENSISFGAGWRSRGWKQTKGKGMRSSWMFIWSLGLGKSLSPRVSLSFPGPRRRQLPHIALCALQPRPLLPQLPQQAQSSICSDSSFRGKRFLLEMSNWSAPYCLVVTKISFAETVLAWNHLHCYRNEVFMAYFKNIFHWKVKIMEFSLSISSFPPIWSEA